MEWLIEGLAPAVVALVQLAVVTAALHVARLAKARAEAAERELERAIAAEVSRPSASSSNTPV